MFNRKGRAGSAQLLQTGNDLMAGHDAAEMVEDFTVPENVHGGQPPEVVPEREGFGSINIYPIKRHAAFKKTREPIYDVVHHGAVT